VRFIGYLTERRRVAACYAAADAFLFASQTETQGLVLLEAMASGVPVVAVAALGAAELLPADSGAVVVPLECDAFGAATLALLENREHRAGIVARQHAFVSGWSEASMSRRLVEVYRGLLAPAARLAAVTPRVGDA
jgi:hypothetical protein